MTRRRSFIACTGTGTLHDQEEELHSLYWYWYTAEQRNVYRILVDKPG
jgi:hypothetical protein